MHHNLPVRRGSGGCARPPARSLGWRGWPITRGTCAARVPDSQPRSRPARSRRCSPRSQRLQLRQQSRGGDTLVDDVRWHGGLHQSLALRADPLAADVALDREDAGRVIQLLGRVFANPFELATPATSGALRLMMVFDARQIGGGTARLGTCLSLGPLLGARCSICRASAARSVSMVSSMRLFCSALRASDLVSVSRLAAITDRDLAGRCAHALRPDDLHRHGAAAQFDFDAAPLSRLRGRCLKAHRHELARHDRCAAAPPSQLAPTVHDVGIDAMQHRHLGYRRVGRFTLRHHLRLELEAVAPPSRCLLACHRVHVSLGWTRSLLLLCHKSSFAPALPQQGHCPRRAISV